MKKEGYSGLMIIVTAAVMLELISAAQYYYMRNELSNELEKRAENELTTKAILIKGTLNSAEDLLTNHEWNLRENLANPDSVMSAVQRIVKLGRHLRGASVAFVPDYYPSKGRLYEPYVRRTGDSLVSRQAASSQHDYTQSMMYKRALQAKEGFWANPYVDNGGKGEMVTTYALPLYDKKGKLAAATAIDVSLQWLSDTIDSRRIYPSSFVLLLTENGQPIIQPSEKRISKKTSEFVMNLINDTAVERKKSSSGRTTKLYFDTDERDGTIFYSYLKGQPHWLLVVVCYDDEVYGKLIQSRIIVLFMSLVGLLLLGYILYRTTRYARNLQTARMEQEHINSELSIASRIQMEMLQTRSSNNSERDDISVSCSLEPAKEVGGDLYVRFVRDEKLFFCIGDVSGKGVPAAIIMAVVHSLFRMASAHESNPAHIMQTINEVSCQNNDSNMFVTLFIGVLDLPTGHLRYCNAGHDVPIVIKGQGTRDDEQEATPLDAKANLPVGVFGDFNYEMQKLALKAGDMLFLYTDGLTEAHNSQRQQFRLEGVMEVLRGMGDATPQQLLDKMSDTVNRFMDGTPQSDDLTMMAIRYTPKEHKIVFSDELTLENDVHQITKLNDFVKHITSQLNMESSVAKNLRLAVEESVVNVMDYAYPQNTVGSITVHAQSDGDTLQFVITDSGVAFDPTKTVAADTSLSAEDRPIGGLGILLVRELMDSINYERIDGKNVLTLIKKL